MAGLNPLHDRVLVRRDKSETTRPSGLVIPDNAKEAPVTGTVIAVGPGRWRADGKERVPMSVEKGDKVLFAKYGGQEIELEGTKHVVLREEELLGQVV